MTISGLKTQKLRKWVRTQDPSHTKVQVGTIVYIYTYNVTHKRRKSKNKRDISKHLEN